MSGVSGSGRRLPNPVWVLWPLGGLLAAYLLVPIGYFFLRLITAPPSELLVPGLWSAIATSLQTATISMIVIAILGVPLAFVLARWKRSAVLGFLIQLPLALPPLAAGILLIYVIGDYTIPGEIFHGNLVETPVGIVLAQTFVSAPFAIVSARSAFMAIDPALDDVAATLGHGPLARIWHVWLRGAAGGIGAGLTLSWLRAFGEYGATSLVAYYPHTLPVFIDVQFASTGLPTTVSAVAASLLVPFVLISIAALIPRVPLRRANARIPPPRQPAPMPGPRVAFSLDANRGTFHLHEALTRGDRHLAVLGPSGAGKTFTLRLIAGLDRSPGSEVRFDDRLVSGLPAEARRVGYVPQDSALLPGRTVWRQVLFGVGADPGLAAYWLQTLGLSGLENRLPEQLSGGQRRRVAIARALATGPALLLLDEPFTGLDTPVRAQLRRELRALQRATQLSTILVTHDAEEAATLADTVLVIDQGGLAQAGPQPEVYAHPASPLVARLLGIQNVFTGEIAGPGRIRSHGLLFRISGSTPPSGTRVTWSIRSEAVRISTGGVAAEGVAARVGDRIDLGATCELELALSIDLRCFARVPVAEAPEVGEQCRVMLDPAAITVWPDQRGPERGEEPASAEPAGGRAVH
jgi:ABC-type sulfate/molybdate transport systems ATPase subunit/ABC-type sulfate transport system permease component